MGGKNSSPAATTTTQTSSPWAGQQPYLTGGTAADGSNIPGTLPTAANLYSSGQLSPAYYPGQTVASQSPYTQQAISGLAGQATSAQTQGLTNAANQQITDTLNGNYLDPTQNPGFQQALTDTQKAYSTGTAAQTDAAFNNAGDYGGSAYDETKQNQNKAYADSLNTLAGNLYTSGRTNQLQAAALAPSTNNIGYTNQAQLGSAGSTQDAYNQSLINANMAQYNYNANLPYNSLSNYAGLVGGSYGNSSTTSQPNQGNSLLSGLGLGLGVLGNGQNLASGYGALSGLFGGGSAAAGGAADAYGSAETADALAPLLFA